MLNVLAVHSLYSDKVKSPAKEDWEGVLKYADRVRQITYNENAGNVSASIFSILQETNPRSYILPHLLEVNWKVETPANLTHCAMFFNPELRTVNLEVMTRVPNLNFFLSEMSSRTRLTSFSFTSPTSLPDAFTHLLKRQDALEQVALVAPGALAPGVGHWVASLSQLKALRLDLTSRSAIAVGGFFDELHPRSGASTPQSVGSTDSGVFSEEDIGISMVRSKSKEPFAELRKLHLTGEAANISVFATRLNCPLTQLELVIEDPPDRADWHDLSSLICDKFGQTLQSLKISSTGSFRVVDLARSAARVEQIPGQLSLERLTYLSCLSRLEIDLPESTIFTESDMESIGNACPNLEILKLCPVARASNAPQITLDSVGNLLVKCRRLHTIAAVVHAKKGSADVLSSRQTSSKALLRLHVGHSWIGDPLQVAILLSHLAPHLETLKFFQENNRPGFIEAHARNWQTVTELLPHLQRVRLFEQQLFSPVVHVQPVRPETLEKGVDAVCRTVEQGVQVVPDFTHASVQCSTALVDQVVQTESTYHSVSIDATTTIAESGPEVLTAIDREIDASSPEPTKANPPGITECVEALITSDTFGKPVPHRGLPPLFLFPSILGLLSIAYRLFFLYPMSLPSCIIRKAVARVPWKAPEPAKPQNSSTSHVTSSSGPEIMDIHLDTFSEVGL